MSATVYDNSPSLPVTVQSLRCIQRVQDFTGRDGKPVHIERRALQILWSDASGVQTVGVAAPVMGWSLDLQPLESKPLVLHCSSFETDKSGVCVFRFCGYEIRPK